MQLKSLLERLRREVRQRSLEAGEAGWGKPRALPPRLSGASASKSFRVGVIGAGAQGIAQCQGMRSVKGIEIAGLAEVDPDRLRSAGGILQLSDASLFSSAKEMLSRLGQLDLVCVATTAPFHVALGRLARQAGARRILLEKPVDTSLKEARAFRLECRAAGVALAVNYSRRWMPDYLAIKQCIRQKFIGEPRSISIILGKGELAMHGSHYFDLCCFLLRSYPATGFSRLEPVTEANVRGTRYQDPAGYCLFIFQNGARAFVDFSTDLETKDPFIVIRGASGRITVDETRQFWTLQSRSNRVWSIPFVEPLKSSTAFAHVAADILSRTDNTPSDSDGIAALEMVLASHLSQQRGNQVVTFPLSDADAELGVEFP